VLISGYANALYDAALANWSRRQFDVPDNTAGGTKKGRKMEVLWFNFGEKTNVARSLAAAEMPASI
jgi:hypothetical protein